MSRLRAHLTYANVMVTILAVVVLGGGAAYAASHLAKNSVGPRQLRKNAVTAKKIKKGAVTAAKVRKDSLGGAQIDEARLGTVPTAADAATLGGLPPADFLASDRVDFGTGYATATTPEQLIDLSELGITVTTDGDADTEPNVVVHLPAEYWFVFNENVGSGAQMYSLVKGGLLPLIATEDPGKRSSYLSVLIWRTDPKAGMYLRCVFDTHGFTTTRPLACWALRV